MKYDLAIFDLDGTILNTLQDLTDSVNYVLSKHNLPLRTIVEIRSFLGNGAKNLIKKAVGNNCSEDIFNDIFIEYLEYYRLHSNDKTKPYDGIIETIKTLRANNVKIAVISNKQDSEVIKLCKIHFNGLTDYVMGERKNTPKKPNPYTVFEVINNNSVDKNKTIFIGDSEVDIATAKNAEIDSIAVTWGYRDKELLEEYSPTYFAENANEIINIIK